MTRPPSRSYSSSHVPSPMLVRTFADRDIAPALALTNHFIKNTAVHFGTSPQTEQEFAAMWRSGGEKYPWLAAEVEDGKTGLSGTKGFAGFAKAGVWRTREAYSLTAEVTVYVDP